MVMRQMRENTKWIMLVTALAFVALMVFEWGMDMSGQSSAQLTGAGEIGSVNGEAISYEQYSLTYQNLYEQQQAALQGQTITPAMNRQIEQAAFDQVVMQMLIADELVRRGIEVTDAEVRQAARFAPPQEFMTNELFLTDGQFDLGKYHQFLASPALDARLLQQLETYYRDMIPRSKLYFQTVSGVYVNDSELWRMYRDQNETATIRYLAFDPEQLVPDAAVTVSEAELRRYFEEHEDDFLRPARARVKYLVLNRTPAAADSAAALARAQEIRARILGGADFGEVARQESADSLSAVEGGALDIRRGQTVGPFDTAAFSLPIGQVSQPVQTAYGYHILRVDERGGDSASVRHILLPIELTEENEGALLDRADSLDILAEDLKLDTIGSRLGLTVREVDLVPSLSIVPDIGIAEDGEHWAFEQAPQPGEVSPVFETPSTYYVFELIERQEERTLTLDEAEPTVQAAVRIGKKLETALQTAREAAERIRAGETMDAVAAANGLTVEEAGPFTRVDFVTGLGRLNPAVGTAFGLRTGQTSGVVESDNKLYIIQLTSREDAIRQTFEEQKDQQRLQISAALAEQRWSQFLEALRTSADIEDGRARTLANTAAQPAS
jgi:peptidyl-prolyl cis-trans isomerase D